MHNVQVRLLFQVCAFLRNPMTPEMFNNCLNNAFAGITRQRFQLANASIGVPLL